MLMKYIYLFLFPIIYIFIFYFLNFFVFQLWKVMTKNYHIFLKICTSSRKTKKMLVVSGGSRVCYPDHGFHLGRYQRPGCTHRSLLASQKYISSIWQNSQLFITMCVKKGCLREGRFQSLLEASIYFPNIFNFTVKLFFT